LYSSVFYYFPLFSPVFFLQFGATQPEQLQKRLKSGAWITHNELRITIPLPCSKPYFLRMKAKKIRIDDGLCVSENKKKLEPCEPLFFSAKNA